MHVHVTVILLIMKFCCTRDLLLSLSAGLYYKMWCGSRPQRGLDTFQITSILCCLTRHSGGFWHERDRERDRERGDQRDRWSPRRRSRSPHFRDRRRSRSNSPPHRSPRRWMTPPISAEEKERKKNGIPPPRDKCCTGEF